MHLWGKMAAKQQMHQQNQASQNHQNPSGLASNLRPHFFSASLKPNLPHSSGYGSTLSALLSGKHNVSYSNSSATSSSSAYPTPPASPLLHPKGSASLHASQSSSATSANSSSSLSSSQKDEQYAMLAAMASQTVLRKMGNAFWDAFTGSSSHSSSSSGGDWDADKVRKILEGKAVLRVVDVEPATAPATASSVSSTLTTPSASSKWASVASRSSLGQSRSTVASTSSASSNLPSATEDGNRMSCKCKTAVCDILEESMRGLSLGKKM